MSPKPLIVALAALPLLAVALPAAAQNPAPRPPVPRARIDINPGPRLYRRCTDWYELQYRPSGTVIFPQKHCWWVRG
jgi:hypothetical protein